MKIVYLSKNNKLDCNHYLFGTNQQLNHKNSLLANSTISFINKQNNDVPIKRLITFNPFIFRSTNFENLRYLEFKNENLKSDYGFDRPIFLNFNNLEVLKIDLVLEEDEDEDEDEDEGEYKLKFFVNCPKLHSFYTNRQLNKITISNPLTIEYIKYIEKHFEEFEEFEVFEESFDKFINLERLTLFAFDYAEYPSKLFEKNKLLKEINIYYTNESTLDDLKDEKYENDLDELKIFYKNINIENSDFDFELIDEISMDFLGDKDIETYTKYSNYLSDNFIEFNNQIILSNLDNLTDQNLSILSHFKYLTTMIINNSITSFEKWNFVLQQFKLSYLYLNAQIGQAFLDIIPAYLKSTLTILKLNQNDTNLDFILQLPLLSNLTIYDTIIDLDLFKKLIKSNENMIEILFLNNFKIEVKDKDIICLFNYKITFKEPKNIFLCSTLNRLQSLTSLFTANCPFVK